MTVRGVEAHVEALFSRRKKKRRHPPEIGALERELVEHPGTPVNIRHGGKDGRLVISYGSLDLLDGVPEKIRN